MLHLCDATHRNLDKLKKQTSRNFVKFNKGKCQLLHWRKNSPLSQCRGSGKLGRRFTEKVLSDPDGHQVDHETAMHLCSRGQQRSWLH